jgi:hypothetical protein
MQYILLALLYFGGLFIIHSSVSRGSVLREDDYYLILTEKHVSYFCTVIKVFFIEEVVCQSCEQSLWVIYFQLKKQVIRPVSILSR